MSAAILFGALLGAVVIVAYLERCSIRADFHRFVDAYPEAMRGKEAQVRAKVSEDVRLIVSDIKAWAAKEAAKPEAVIGQFEARLKQVI